ncbi:hypothetical protein SISNIDRAFT_450294 [Sistotremastrum niveocremeum HHB9708]|uniref:Uncharacterized protein n=2 Tax=Sistotremastraceae TaxID=3402574 RepID=A0A164Z2N1_9AGAM|nr:hypothetical protein SISNIDRAFT_450294 [Sistotremastrum niveocremeum HHB9708]KZT34057.1 hypothetical protein SISSUDRAFT_1053390 [Sistotremastrum suecicum HHB10207 ss-3]
MTRFGSFAALCKDIPMPWCNLFVRQLSKHSPQTLLPPSSNFTLAPVGVNPSCAINRISQPGSFGGTSLGNIAQIIACAACFFFVVFLIIKVSRRRAAVGRVEFRIFLMIYLLSLPLNLLTTGSVLKQGSLPLVILTAVHAGVVAALFWALLANGIVSTQVVEDGTLSSLIPFYALIIAFFAATTYISLDVALTITHSFGPSNPPEDLESIPLFVLTNIWPGAATLIFFAIMLYIILGILREIRPIWFYILAFTIFVLSQLDYYLLSKTICVGTKAKIDGLFVATLLETAAVGVLYLGWTSITEDAWDENDYYRNSIGL